MVFNRYIITIVTALAASSLARGDALARLKPERLEAVHKAVADLKSQWQKPDPAGPFRDFRANLHVHSGLSHDSRGKIEDIVAAARAAGSRILMFTEHPADHYDYFKDGHRGNRDGVLLIPGAETSGFLAFPNRSLRGVKTGSPQEFSDLVRRDGGLVFLSHLEERMDWKIRGLTGSEIYNTHADFKDEKNLIAALRNPLWFFTAIELFQKYPQEAFSALQDYPADYLRRWDQLCALAPHTGVAANDSHQNAGLVVRLAKGDKARFEDVLGKKLFELPVNLVPPLQKLAQDKKEGEVVFQLLLDPYPVSLRHVGTHLFLKGLGEKEVREALEAGRAYVSFDWLADATGFDFAAHSPGRRYEMGSRMVFEKGLQLRARAPLPVKWKLLRQGKVIQEEKGRSFQIAATEQGIYRIEAWLEVAGQPMIWILSNPIYIRPRK